MWVDVLGHPDRRESWLKKIHLDLVFSDVPPLYKESFPSFKAAIYLLCSLIIPHFILEGARNRFSLFIHIFIYNFFKKKNPVN